MLLWRSLIKEIANVNLNTLTFVELIFFIILSLPEESDEYSMESFDETQKRNEVAALKTLISVQDKRIHEFVKSRIENAILVENIGTEMTFSISNKVDYTRNYEKFFHQAEMNMDSLGIDSIGISDTTLEEIFIKLASEPMTNQFQNSDWKFFGLNLSKLKKSICARTCQKNKSKKEEITAEKLEEYASYTKYRVKNKPHLVFQQLYALLVKRLHRVKRNVKGFIAEIVVPVVFVCLALLVATLMPADTGRPPLELHPWYYPTPNRMFVSQSSSLNFDTPVYDLSSGKVHLLVNTSVQSNYANVKQVTDTFIRSPGLGTRCMKGSVFSQFMKK